MTRKTENLELLTDAEISNRLLKTLKKVQGTFAGLALFAIVATGFGFALNSWDQRFAGGIVSLASALVVIAGAFYVRKLRRDNDALIAVSNKRNVEI